MIEIGDRIWWEGISKTISGIVEEIQPNDNYLVRLDNGKYVIVNELSILKWGKP